jgi:hypothetical protein
MAKVQVRGQRCPLGDQMLVRGVFTQCKKLGEAMEKVFKSGQLSDLMLIDDISDKTIPATYGNMCKQLRQTGRAALVDQGGQREFQVVDAVQNEIRGWDVDQEGPRCNPVER